jgi:hypothetical protein
MRIALLGFEFGLRLYPEAAHRENYLPPGVLALCNIAQIAENRISELLMQRVMADMTPRDSVRMRYRLQGKLVGRGIVNEDLIPVTCSVEAVTASLNYAAAGHVGRAVEGGQRIQLIDPARPPGTLPGRREKTSRNLRP